jgi:hypothetical protein
MTRLLLLAAGAVIALPAAAIADEMEASHGFYFDTGWRSMRLTPAAADSSLQRIRGSSTWDLGLGYSIASSFHIGVELGLFDSESNDPDLPNGEGGVAYGFSAEYRRLFWRRPRGGWTLLVGGGAGIIWASSIRTSAPSENVICIPSCNAIKDSFGGNFHVDARLASHYLVAGKAGVFAGVGPFVGARYYAFGADLEPALSIGIQSDFLPWEF